QRGARAGRRGTELLGERALPWNEAARRRLAERASGVAVASFLPGVAVHRGAPSIRRTRDEVVECSRLPRLVMVARPLRSVRAACYAATVCPLPPSAHCVTCPPNMLAEGTADVRSQTPHPGRDPCTPPPVSGWTSPRASIAQDDGRTAW